MTMKTDTYTRHGAERLATSIKSHWRNDSVKVWLEPKAVPGYMFNLWFVKSNLVNGMPPKAKNARAVA